MESTIFYLVDGVTVQKQKAGKLVFEIPQSMDGASLSRWKKRNEKALIRIESGSPEAVRYISSNPAHNNATVTTVNEDAKTEIIKEFGAAKIEITQLISKEIENAKNVNSGAISLLAATVKLALPKPSEAHFRQIFGRFYVKEQKPRDHYRP